jgi:hypothetical protein
LKICKEFGSCFDIVGILIRVVEKLLLGRFDK